MTTKIAPTLTSLVDGHKFAYPEAHRELRALLAVARAAKTLSFYRAEYEGHGCMGVSGNTDALTRALARLAKAAR